MKWEKISAIHIFCKGLIPKIYKNSYNWIANKKPTSFKKGPKVSKDIFSKEDIQMANRHRRRCSTFVIINEMQITPTEVTPSHLPKQRSSRRTQINVGEDVEKKKHLNTVDGDVNWCSQYGKQHEGSSKTKTILRSSKPLLDIYWGKTVNCKDDALLVITPKMWKQPKCPLPHG